MRICRQGERASEFFSDKRFGDSNNARDAAEQRYAELDVAMPPRSKTRDSRSTRNQSGIVGVHLAVSHDTNNLPHKAYCASWIEDAGHRKKLSFSWKKYGELQAWELACLARELKIQDRQKLSAIYESRSAKQAKHRMNKPR